MLPAFPKPGQVKKPRPAFREFADGRIVFDTTTKAGREGYRANTRTAFDRQGRVCGLQVTPQCREREGRWPFDMIQLDHAAGRGMGGAKRDDRVVDENGKPMNLAVCPWCNSYKGSRPLSALAAEGFVP